MKFLIDEDLPRSVGSIFNLSGHEVLDVRDVGLRGAADSQIAEYAKTNSLCLITGDFDFSDIRNYPPSQYSGIIVIDFPRGATATYILNLFNDFLKQKNLISKINGKLAIIEPGRIRIRED
ncbi:MAG: DUF5615 family PIN-like protein [Bacteroidota bacterium]|nr:DUF5615 family PIN-like protein [Bacteroidota bacterium]